MCFNAVAVKRGRDIYKREKCLILHRQCVLKLKWKARKSLGGLEEDEPVQTGLKIAFQPKWNVIPYIVFSCYFSFPRMPKSKELVSSSSSASDSDSEVDKKVNIMYSSLLY